MFKRPGQEAERSNKRHLGVKGTLGGRLGGLNNFKVGGGILSESELFHVLRNHCLHLTDGKISPESLSEKATEFVMAELGTEPRSPDVCPTLIPQLTRPLQSSIVLHIMQLG